MSILDAPPRQFVGLKPTCVLFGDSRTADCELDVVPNYYTTNMSWWDWGAASVSGGAPLDVVKNAGVGGNTTAQMLARIKADVLDYRPGYMTIWGGTNDGWTTTTGVDQSFSNMTQMIERARAAGIYVFVISETVRSSSAGAAFPGLVQYYNERLRNYCAVTPGTEFWDFNALVVDPANANGYAKSTMLRDGVHLSPYGASVIGKNVVAAKLGRLGSRVAMLLCSQIDTRSINASSRNILLNPLMLGSTAASGTGQTGTWPSNWTTSGQSAVCSTPARADGYGNDLKAEITASAGGSFFMTQNASANLAHLVAGRRYVLEASLAVDAAVNVSQVSLTVDLNQSGQTYRRGWGYAVQATASGDSLQTMDGVIRSRVFTAPDGTYGAMSAMGRVLFAGAGSATVRIGRVSLKHVD